ncbi:MAG TPA: hypothetical protein VFH14_06830 [Gemmatimonadaceae bacterium]|nr:hypothetical protein [Gemmatimonadaceae bacterium]
MRVRPGRRRKHKLSEPPHLLRRAVEDATAGTVVRATERPEAQTGGGGSSGRGPVDDDGGRRPDRDGDDARRLLVALGLIAVGFTVMSARLLARTGRPPQISSRFYRPWP